MQKSSFKNKLTFKIPLQIVSLVAVAIAGICVVLGVFLSISKQQSVMNEINYLAENNSYLVSSYLDNMQTISKSMASEIYRYKNSDTSVTDKLIRETLDASIDDSRIFGTFVALEPNTLIANTPKGISYYSYKEGDQKKLEVMNDYDDYNVADYYAATKQTLKPHLTEPYSFELESGETVWLVTISYPILDENGKFIGVTNTDILSDTINNLSYNMGKYKTSSNYILTDASNYVSNTADRKKAGTKFVKQQDNNIFTVSQPLKIDGIDNHWSSSFTVQRSEAMQEVTSTLWMISIVGIVGILIIALVIFLLIKKSLSPIDSIVELFTNMGKGKLNSDISVHTKDELGQLAAISKSTSAELSGYVYEISDTLDRLSNGDLNIWVARDYIGDFKPIKNALLKIIDSLNNIFSEIGIATEQVSVGASQIANGAQSLAQGTTEQASSLEELSASINDISNQVKQNADHANYAEVLAQDAQQNLNQGKDAIAQMTGAINEIDNYSQEITKIIKTIDDIAFQTNILALNAAVEAARAGAAGKGFAVVANEVRNLAAKSAEAAKQTAQLIDGSVYAVQNGAETAARTAELLNQIIEKSMGVNNIVTQIALATNEQSRSIELIESGVMQISTVVQTNSATAEQSSAAAEELSSQANMLREKLSMFELKGKRAEE